MISLGPVIGLGSALRLAQSVPETPENFRVLRELIQLLTNLLNIQEKEDED